MLPSLEEIVRKRHQTRKWLRFSSLILFVLGSMPVTLQITQMLANFSWRPYGWDDMFSYSIMFILPGVIILLLSRKLVHWLVPLPQPECPECRYSLKNLTKPRCPECGLDLPDAMISPIAPSVDPLHKSESSPESG